MLKSALLTSAATVEGTARLRGWLTVLLSWAEDEVRETAVARQQ